VSGSPLKLVCQVGNHLRIWLMECESISVLFNEPTRKEIDECWHQMVDCVHADAAECVHFKRRLKICCHSRNR